VAEGEKKSFRESIDRQRVEKPPQTCIQADLLPGSGRDCAGHLGRTADPLRTGRDGTGMGFGPVPTGAGPAEGASRRVW
jgi:hypothetical protein